ncbi:DUF4864 domain-containing protein [Devosia sp.]|uniref:DUF4864 domain-containing protein n=1 Tax=Devosia sp. TaxID=1871048 RepID=UPI002F0C8C10
MRSLSGMRLLLVSIALAAAGLAVPAGGEDAASPEAWQAVISSQIQAFREHDAPEAFSHAGIAFQAAFPNAEIFFLAIVQSGYAPIMESGSHHFGAFRLGPDGVMQSVTFVGKDQSLYDAVYQLTEESGHWRVQGVQLMPPRGVAI